MLMDQEDNGELNSPSISYQNTQKQTEARARRGMGRIRLASEKSCKGMNGLSSDFKHLRDLSLDFEGVKAGESSI